jgi:hypothetical protein
MTAANHQTTLLARMNVNSECAICAKPIRDAIKNSHDITDATKTVSTVRPGVCLTGSAPSYWPTP